jgi:hypothetical protein
MGMQSVALWKRLGRNRNEFSKGALGGHGEESRMRTRESVWRRLEKRP